MAHSDHSATHNTPHTHHTRTHITPQVGYGDISPSTESGRIMACIYIPICLGIYANCLGTIADVYFRLMGLNSDR